MKLLITILSLVCVLANIQAQILPADRSVQWEHAGLRFNTLPADTIIYFNEEGGIPDGVSNNTLAMNLLLDALEDKTTIIEFGPGTYIFNAPILLPNQVILRGAGAESTTLKFQGTIPGHLIRIQGSIEPYRYYFSASASRFDSIIIVPHGGTIAVGDYIKITQNDSSLVTNDWAYGTVGQIVAVKSIRGDTLLLHSALRLSYPMALRPKIQKINAARNAGISCLKIIRAAHSENQSANILFDYAVASWVDGIESDSCVYAHVTIANSSNILVENSYFHHAFEYGSGGKGYGVMLHLTSNECLIQNNIFRHLRHAMIVQAGANANVFGYNYSIEPYWTDVGILPANSAGDMVLHGNYPYANLFESNIGQHIVVDDSHGKNGPFNTFFRNRAASYGLFMNSTPPSDSQNYIGNEIPNMGLLMGNFHLTGTGHLSYGNHVKGTIIPEGTSILADSTYYLRHKPAFLAPIDIPSIGIPNAMDAGTITSKSRYEEGTFTTCISSDSATLIPSIPNGNIQLLLYPNPISQQINIQNLGPTIPEARIQLLDMQGLIRLENMYTIANTISIDISHLPAGIYLIKVLAPMGTYTNKIIKIH